jgi:hypothetical protein
MKLDDYVIGKSEHHLNHKFPDSGLNKKLIFSIFSIGISDVEIET